MFPKLFSSIPIGKKIARNRLMRTATTSNLAEKQRVSPRQIEFYRRLAKGGVGVIVTESVAVHPSYSGGQGTLQLYDPDLLPGLTELTTAVRSEGALFICQLRHGGRQHHSRQTPTLWAPSAIACVHSGTIPHAMTLSEVQEVIDGFVISARHAKQAGFDGVEIQGGNGHLIQEFISGYSNKRTDRYGGDYSGRLTFARDIISAVRSEVGPDFIVGYRLSVDEFVEEGITLDESVRTAREFAGSGLIDYMGLTQGNFYSIETHLPDRRFPANTFVASHDAQIKMAVSEVSTIPVVASGRIRRPEDAEAILESGQADMIGMCRQLIADPDWPTKARDGRADMIRMCTNGNHCWGRIRSGDPIGCEINVESGQERTTKYEAASAPRKIVVIGAGPAGLEATRIASERGHQVVIFERSETVGGKLADVPDIRGYSELLDYIGSQRRQLFANNRVTLRLKTEATPATVGAEHPDEVIIATGATLSRPDTKVDETVKTFCHGADLPNAPPGTVAIITDEDGDTWCAAEAERVAMKGYKPVIVTRFFEAFRDIPISSRITTLKRMDELGVEFHVNSELEKIERGQAMIRHAYTKRSVNVANVTALLCVGRQTSNNQLAQELKDAGFSVHLIGDAYAPRRLFHATHEAYRVASRL
jgi:2,4-dienoyl-CoA reductase-like NADH-dependent reductase (Old Yellow Enzyme family)/thioredoxin reductase